MSLPIDQPQRTRFVTELERNFSVVASAGSGKTRAITDRIVALARHDRALDWLPSLVVVTYTNRAAAEMQQRARESIVEASVRPEILAAFNRAFFGTIHSLCLRLLRQHGHHLGLPGELDHLDEGNDAPLWTEYVQQQTTLGGALDADQQRALLRLASARTLMELGRKSHLLENALPPGPFPVFDFGEIHAFAADQRSLAAATRCRGALLRWTEAWAGGGFAGPLPACESKPLRPVWEAAVAPLRAWLQCAALHVAAETARGYRAFRLRRGAMTFHDQISLAAALLRQPEAARRIRAKNHRVILDEAQDTDPVQFEVLLEMTRPEVAEGAWLEGALFPPRAGHFCMVGDFQQSIYGARADLAHYLRIHEALRQSGAGEALEFSVTFRLDEAGLGWVNAAFPAILNGAAGQVAFVQLNPRPAVLPGQVARLDLSELPDTTDWKDWRKAHWEADRLALWLREQGLAKLRASSWSQVALLCPRTRWLPALRAALHRAGLPAQVQSERAIKGDSAAYAWFTALAVALAEPRNGYEIVGVLREVFGLSDQELADFAQGRGERFQIFSPTARAGLAGDTLRLLAELRARIATLPLFSAMREMLRTTRLRERLHALPASESEGLDTEIENLLTHAAAAEAAGATPEIFAAQLRTGFHGTREVKAVALEAVQIISGHKAKGSEWDAVIVPFFARRVTVSAPGYPRTLRDPRTRAFLAALDGGDIEEELKTALDVQARQELERVLYVALTRARHTLVLVDDRALFSGKSGLPKNAQARLLRCAAADLHAVRFDALPAALSPCADTIKMETTQSASRARAQIVPPLPACAPETFTAGGARAAHFLKRNPSALAEAALAEADPGAYAAMTLRATAGLNSGQLYGTWWHQFVERLDWPAGSAAWDAAFVKELPQSPDPARSRREGQLLRAFLTADSDLFRLLTEPGVIVHAEMPFLWAMSDRECLDGIIDLAVFDPATTSWLILDWKTNRQSVADLRAHYLPQLSAYVQAAKVMLGAPVAAGIYSTTTGHWLPYQAEELAAAWEKLRAAPTEIERVLTEE